MKVDVIFKDATVLEAKKLIACAEQLELKLDEPTPADVEETATEEVEEVEETATAEVEDTDADGLKWDGRIHSSSKKKNSDGRWARRRNVDDATFNKIKNELLGVVDAQPAPTPVAAPVAAPAPVAQPAPLPAAPAPTPVAAPVAAPAPVAQPAPLPAAPAPVAQPAALPTDAEIRARIQKGVVSKLLNANDVQNVMNDLNARGIPVISLTEGLRNPLVIQAFDEMLKTKGV